MTIAVHKGVIVELEKDMKLSGIQIDASVANQIILGSVVFPRNSQAQSIADHLSRTLFIDRHRLMKEWEENHPGENPFPEPFARTVLNLLRTDPDIDLNNPAIIKIIKMAETELSP